MRSAARLFILLLLAAGSARAHGFLQNVVWIEATPQRISLLLEVTVRELMVIQGMPGAEDGTFDPEVAADLAPKHVPYLLDHFLLKADGQRLNGTITKIVPHKGTASAGPDRARFDYHIDFPLASPPAVLTIFETMGREFPIAPGIPWEITYKYNYGPPDGAVLFGAIAPGSEISIATGFAGTADHPDAGARRPALFEWPKEKFWVALWLVFCAVLGLGSTRLSLLNYQAASAIWLGAYLLFALAAPAVPAWLPAILCGAITILSAVNNIYTHSAEPQSMRRRALLISGAFFFGIALSSQQPPFNEGGRTWPVLLFLGAVVTAAVICAVVRLGQRRNARLASTAMQVASLALCGASIWLMLRLLGIRIAGS